MEERRGGAEGEVGGHEQHLGREGESNGDAHHSYLAHNKVCKQVVCWVKTIVYKECRL